MRKTNKNLTKQILTLALAFVMVFTGMGIGSWGVDTAWADEIVINLEVTGVSIYDDAHDINISIAGSPINKLYVKTVDDKNSFKIKQTIGPNRISIYTAAGVKGYGGVSWNKTRCVTPSDDHGYITDAATLRKAGLRETDFDTGYKYYFLAPIKQGYAFLLQVKKISYDTNKTELNNWIAKVTDENASNWYQSEDTYNGKTESSQGFWTELQSVLSEAQTISADSSYDQTAVDTATSKLKAKVENLISKKYVNASGLYENVKAARTKQEIGYTVASWGVFKTAWNQAEQLLSALYNEDGTPKSANRGPNAEDDATAESIEQAKVDEITTALANAINNLIADKTKLEEAIAKVTGANAAKWHQENDKYNGKELSQNGFWSAMQEKLTLAEQIRNKEGATGEEIATATSNLQSAIANLIPKSQLNATKLYEALRPVYWEYGESARYDHITFEDRGEVNKVSADNCTQASWTAYTQAKEPAAAYLAKLFDKDGNATAFNKAEAAKGDQPGETEADKLADAIDPTQLVNQKTYDEAYQNWKTREAEAASLLVQYDPTKLAETDYTAVSWKTYADTYQALKDIAEYRIVGGTKADYDVLKTFYQNVDWLTNLLPQSYNKLESKEGVTVTLQYTNGLAAAYPAVRGNGTDAYSGEISLAKGSTTVKDALAQTKITVHIGTGISGVLPKVTGSSFDSASKAWFAVYINDEFRGVYQNVSSLSKVYLKNDDSIRVNRIVQPLFESEESSGMTSSAIYRLPADASMYQDSAAVIGIDSITTDLKVGDKAKLQLSLKDAYGTDSGTQRSAEGITLFVSETPGKTEDTAGQPTRKTIAVTNASGNAEYVFAEEGWYWVAAHNVTPDKYYFQNIYRETTDGIYYSLQCGDAMLVYVSANEDESALIAAQRNENLAKAKAFYESFQAHDFPAGYYAGDFKIAYENLKTHQNEATTFKALMDSFEADYADLQLCAEQKLDHDARIASLRENLSYVPEDLSTLNDGDKDFIKSVQNAYADLNDYEKNLLTPKELEKLEATAKVDAAKLPVRATVQVKKAYDDSTLPKKNDDGGATNYGWPNRAWHLPPNPDGSEPEPKWGVGDGTVSDLPFSAKAGDYVVVRKYLSTTDAQYWMVWTIDNWQTTHLAEAQTLPSRDTNGLIIMWHDGYFLAKYQIPKDIADGSTITFDLKMVDKATYESLAGITETPEQLAAAKSAALESLKAAYQAYNKNNYTDGSNDADGKPTVDHWSKLVQAYEDGKAAIEQAATATNASIAAITAARKAALAAMAAVPVKSSTSKPETEPGAEDYNSGTIVGKVSVTIENTKYAGGAFSGTIASGQYDLGENDSMMTCVLKALKQAGYSWQGTSGSSKDKNADYSITYLSSIEKDGKSLGEFDGNSKSGWMGTLNDWFVNQGFHAFTVKNGQLENGDEIHVMFTMAYGEDLGGTWNNNSTKLAGLTVSGGTLSPTFSGSQTDYMLIISGDKANVTVKPEAVNKNYQARIFLNRYNQDSARYKRTETISVKSGDILYVGVGESGWPTMNASSVGTKYTIKVVSGSDSEAVDKMLKALKKITYANYKAEKGNVEAARAAYNALDAKGKQEIAAADLKKLTDAEAQIKFYSEIDDAKTKLAALPKLTNPTQAQANAYRSQINEATAAYKKLSAEQQKYITKADVENYNALAKALGVSTIVGADAAPESPVETTGKTGSATTTAPTEVKVSGTTAAATVKAENQSEILKQAAENKSAEIVLEVSGFRHEGRGERAAAAGDFVCKEHQR